MKQSIPSVIEEERQHIHSLPVISNDEGGRRNDTVTERIRKWGLNRIIE